MPKGDHGTERGKTQAPSKLNLLLTVDLEDFKVKTWMFHCLSVEKPLFNK